MIRLSLVESLILVVQCLNVKQGVMFFLISILKATLRMYIA
jgi:hypothetical protein